MSTDKKLMAAPATPTLFGGASAMPMHKAVGNVNQAIKGSVRDVNQKDKFLIKEIVIHFTNNDNGRNNLLW